MPLQSLKKMCIYVFQAAVVNELKAKQRQKENKRILNKDDVYHGALEDILLGK